MARRAVEGFGCHYRSSNVETKNRQQSGKNRIYVDSATAAVGKRVGDAELRCLIADVTGKKRFDRRTAVEAFFAGSLFARRRIRRIETDRSRPFVRADEQVAAVDAMDAFWRFACGRNQTQIGGASRIAEIEE